MDDRADDSDERRLHDEVTIPAVLPHPPAGLVAAFDQSAGAVRAASGNRFWQLYANTRKSGEMVLLHAWDNGATPKPWAQLPEGASLRALITQSATHTVELQKI